MTNLKSWLPKKYEDKGPNMHNSNQFMAFQILLYNFLNEFLMWFFFLEDLVYSMRLISKSLQHYRKSKLQWTPLYKILNRKIRINHFQNHIFDAKTILQKELFKNIWPIKNSNLVRFYLTLKGPNTIFWRHSNLDNSLQTIYFSLKFHTLRPNNFHTFWLHG